MVAIPIIIFQALAIADTNNYGFWHHWEDMVSVGEVSGLVLTVIIAGIVLIALFLVGIIAVISASINASNGRIYKYPLCIDFIRPIINQSPPQSASSPDSTEGPFNAPAKE